MTTEPEPQEQLTTEQINFYRENGFLEPVQLLTVKHAEELRTAMSEHVHGTLPSERYELTDPIVVNKKQDSDDYEYDESETSSDPHTFPFLFNMWKHDDRFRSVGLLRSLGRMSRQLLEASSVLLLEDNGLVKNPHSSMVPWHQDFSYWPLETPHTAITIWIALEHVSVANGAMQVVPGSQHSAEHLPVSFKNADTFMNDRDVPELSQTPERDGHTVHSYDLQPGQCGFHHPMLWHSSAPNSADTPRYAFIARHVAERAIWLGDKRIPYDDIGCAAGSPLTPAHFPQV